MFFGFKARTVCKYSLVLALLCAPAAAAETSFVERSVYVMGSPLTFRVYGASRAESSAAIEAAITRVQSLDDLMTTWRPEGELAHVNEALAALDDVGRGVPLSPALAAYLADALDWARRTEGLFDPSIGALVDAWGLRRGGRVPSPELLEAARSASGHTRASLEPMSDSDPTPALRVERAGLAFDLGAIGKGMALDAASVVLRDHGIEAALLNFGGQVLALGPPPGAESWIVGITHPQERERVVLELPLARGSIATSSNVERGFIVEGIPVGHLLDPRTGRPASTRASASVLADTATAADALASALAVGGPGAASEILERESASWLLLEPAEDPASTPLCRASSDLSTHCATLLGRASTHSGRTPHPGDPQENQPCLASPLSSTEASSSLLP